MEKKSANKLWKESGSSLPFKEWIEREKQKFDYTANHKQFVGLDGLKLDTSSIDKKSSNDSPSSFFGLSSTALVVSGVIIIAASGYYFYNKYKKS